MLQIEEEDEGDEENIRPAAPLTVKQMRKKIIKQIQR